jgi:putative transposase
MPSIARMHQLSGSLLYHIYNRGNARSTVFHDGEDYFYFIELLSRYAKKHSFLVYHWVLMPNHFHVLLEMEEPERISSIMSGLARSYVYYYHRKYQSTGHLWQGRFRSQPVEKESYLLACGRYIERNPVKAKMVTSAEDFPYSSACFYVLGKEDNLTSEDPLFSSFGNEVNSRRNRYKLFLESFDVKEESFFEKVEHPRGSQQFLTKLTKEKGLYLPRRQGRPRKELICNRL